MTLHSELPCRWVEDVDFVASDLKGLEVFKLSAFGFKALGLGRFRLGLKIVKAGWICTFQSPEWQG